MKKNKNGWYRVLVFAFLGMAFFWNGDLFLYVVRSILLWMFGMFGWMMMKNED